MAGKGKFATLMDAVDDIKGVDDGPTSTQEDDVRKATHRPRPNDTNSQGIQAQGRSRIESLQAQINEFQKLIDEGRLEQDLDISKIDRPPMAMRSSHYWSSPRFLEIKESIRRNGQHDPITVRPSPTHEGRYILVKGDTRLTSFEMLLNETGDPKWSKIRAKIENIDHKTAILKTLIENRDREDPSAYDQACFHRYALDSVYGGSRAETMAALDITKSTLSRSVTVSNLPTILMDTFPSLFEAGARSLYELSNTVKQHEDRLPALLEAAEELIDKKPKAQIVKLQKFLQDQQKPAPAPRPESITTADGKVLAKIKYGKGTASLFIDEGAMPGFSDLLKEKLEATYHEWLAQQEKDQD
jgi:ParB family chromosome partitioning protein